MKFQSNWFTDLWDWASQNWVSLAIVLVGVVICTLAGLLALTPDPEKPGKFLPVYVLSIALFLCGLSLVMRLDAAMEVVKMVVPI